MRGISLLVMFRLAILVITLLIVISTSNFAVMAQQPNQWSPWQQIPDYLDDTLPPYLVADQNRTVHAFATQWVKDDLDPKAIVYRQWTLAGGWTKPVDILLSPEGEAQIHGAFLDQAGMMHVIFRGGDVQSPNIYYSRAPLASADRAPAWSIPELVGENVLNPSSAALTGDGKGNLIIIYNGNSAGNGVYAVQSSDAGDSWSDPIPVFLTYDLEVIPYYLRIHMGQSGQLHSVWSVVNAKGNTILAYYAKLDVIRQQWNEPIVLAEESVGDLGPGTFGPSYPVVAETGNGDKIVVAYNSNGGPPTNGRPALWVRLSRDKGQTWTEPTRPFPRHVGLSGEHDLVIDGNGIVHVLFIQRIEQQVMGGYSAIGGIWHSELRGNQWTEPDRFSTGNAGYDVHAVISQGNVILVTWRDDPGSGQDGVRYSLTTLKVPELPVVPVPTLPATPTATPLPTATPSVILTPTPSSRLTVVRQGGAATAVTSNPAGPFVIGVVPVILVLAGIVFMYQFFHNRHHY
jgi:hypothetical protein